MNQTSHYVISGGQQGKSRLNTLSHVLQPYTKALLQSIGLNEGMSLLDNGCGGGNVAIMAAKMVGNTGNITAIDFDETIIALAKQDAVEEGLTNITFRTETAYDISYNQTFDIAYARFLLSHLNRPLDALLKMKQAVKTNGKIVIEDLQFSGHFSYPYNNSFQSYLQLYSEVVTRKGGNAEIGPTLINLFEKAGIRDIEFDMIQPCFNKGIGKQMAYLTLDRIKQSLLNEGLITDVELDKILFDLKSFTEDETSIISLPRIFRVWGRV